ncbi:MAG: hypothetical protein ABIJ18_00685 [archaeon]
MQVTINMDTDKETAEDLIKLQKALDELIGKKLGAVSQHSQPAPLQTVNPEPSQVVKSAGFPIQPEQQPRVNATSPYGVGEQVRSQQQSYSEQFQQPRGMSNTGWPSQPQQRQPVEEKKPQREKEIGLDDINEAMSRLYSGGH